ncbi:uncharacterized protein LOC111078457 [Drosophila obscura]|uniref:uncharacterized protein LOC111078457 n=1 Tax=Drosophila obscura TaxID=7282 RepID=UPI001BB13FF0|nr:uncharacterized protein LOC111078457 [Drosophila obscura]
MKQFFIACLVVFELGSSGSHPQKPITISYDPLNVQRDMKDFSISKALKIQQRPSKAREAFQQLETEYKMYFALRQQIQLDQETLDKQIADKKVALQMATIKLAEMETKRRLASCVPRQQTTREVDPGFTRIPQSRYDHKRNGLTTLPISPYDPPLPQIVGK